MQKNILVKVAEGQYVQQIVDMTSEEVAEHEKGSAGTAEEQICILKEELASYDYIGTKIAMGVATREEYAEKIAYTETLRKKIRELEEI